MGRKKLLYLGVIPVAALAYFGWRLTARSAYESAEYLVLEQDGAFEIREYPDLMLVATGSAFESQGDDGSFMRLFGYISGENDGERKIAMTTPVFMEPDDSGAEGEMAFVLPKKVAEQQVPEPSNDNVHVQKRGAGRFAVIRFSGRMNAENSAAAEAKLRKWIDERGLAATGKSEFAGYDPPWTPGPLRRNEVLLRLKSMSQSRIASEGPQARIPSSRARFQFPL